MNENLKTSLAVILAGTVVQLGNAYEGQDNLEAGTIGGGMEQLILSHTASVTVLSQTIDRLNEEVIELEAELELCSP